MTCNTVGFVIDGVTGILGPGIGLLMIGVSVSRSNSALVGVTKSILVSGSRTGSGFGVWGAAFGNWSFIERVAEAVMHGD